MSLLIEDSMTASPTHVFDTVMVAGEEFLG